MTDQWDSSIGAAALAGALRLQRLKMKISLLQRNENPGTACALDRLALRLRYGEALRPAEMLRLLSGLLARRCAADRRKAGNDNARRSGFFPRGVA